MGHDAHFLQRLDRITREQIDFALSLYRDHVAVRYALDHLGLPADAKRVALALVDGGSGPFLIVARDGGFVTCLGEGMSPRPWPVIPRTEVNRQLEAKATLRRTRRLSAEAEERGMSLLEPLVTRTNLLSREELDEIGRFAPLVAAPLHAIGATACVDLVRLVVSSKGRLPPGPHRAQCAKAHAVMAWSAAHAFELLGLADPGCHAKAVRAYKSPRSFSMPLSYLMDFTFVWRGAWAAGMVGEPLVEGYLRELSGSASSARSADAALALAVIALRNQGARGHVTSELEAILERSDSSAPSRDRAESVNHALGVLREPDSAEAYVQERGALRFQSSVGGGSTPSFDGWEDVPLELARTAYMTGPGSLLDLPHERRHLFAAAPTLAKVSATDFHYPRSWGRQLVRPWTEEQVVAHAARIFAGFAPTPVRVATAVSRNAPCACGSGRKSKRCCGTD